MIGRPVGKRRAKSVAASLYQAYVKDGGTLPVDVEKLVAQQGIEVVREAGSDSLSGMLIVDDEGAFVVVNSNDVRKRQRFTLAHELAHFVLHRPEGEAVFHRDEKASQGTDRVEMDANAFAAELLMPEEAVRAEASTCDLDLVTDDGLRNIRAMAKRFGVSEQAMSFRLQNLGIVSVESYW